MDLIILYPIFYFRKGDYTFKTTSSHKPSWANPGRIAEECAASCVEIARRSSQRSMGATGEFQISPSKNLWIGGDVKSCQVSWAHTCREYKGSSNNLVVSLNGGPQYNDPNTIVLTGSPKKYSHKSPFEKLRV